MSIAVSIKVNDGVVLASDSASTLALTDDRIGGRSILNVYNNADKISNLVKGKQIGIVVCGAGGIGASSISTLSKDLRALLSVNNTEWSLGENYTMEEVSNKVRRFFFEEKYQPIYSDAEYKPVIAFFIAGYSYVAEAAEVWQVMIKDGESPEPLLLRDQEGIGINWGGELEAMHRLIMGIGQGFPAALADLGVPEDQIQPAMNQIKARLECPLVVEAMPIQDAIDLARFCVQTTIDFVRFNPGAPTVGGPIEIAAITKHEGFKWVQRKHYFDRKLNLPFGDQNDSSI